MRILLNIKILFYLVVLLTGLTLSKINNLYAEENMDQKFQGFLLHGYDDNGNKSWEVKGDTADIVGTKVKLSNVDANTYNGNRMNVKADTGIIDQASGNMRLEDDVVITTEDGTQLKTDHIDWKRDDDLVLTDDKVVLSDKRMTVVGKGMEARPGLKSAQIKTDVKVKVNTGDDKKAKKFVTITCDGPLEIDQTKSVAIFNNNVVAVQDEQQLKADKIEVFFTPDMKSIKKMICSGNVEITQKENKTFAKQAVYDAITKKIILSGRPKLILQTEGENAITHIGD